MNWWKCFIWGVLVSCSSSEYARLDQGLEKKLIRFGDGELKLKDADHLAMKFSSRLLGHDSNEELSNSFYLADFDTGVFGNGALAKDVFNLVENDSVTYVSEYRHLKNSILDLYIDQDIALADTQTVLLSIGCNMVKDNQAYLALQEERVRAGLVEEMELISEFIINNELQNILSKKGDLYFYKTKETTNPKVRITDDIAIAYECSFLSGKVFNTVTPEEPLYINLSAPSQVIPGMESILKEMNEGESSRIIIPSYLAFGMDGSSDGTVPAKTPIVADVELIEILN